MNLHLRKLAISILGLAMCGTSITPAHAVPVPTPKPVLNGGESAEVSEVDWRRDRRGWHNGHRGYRQFHRGYRRHNDGFWYPLAAFGAGAIIGGAIARPRMMIDTDLSPRHIEWCQSSYRTYRIEDNSYVPRAGMRAECRSPYY